MGKRERRRKMRKMKEAENLKLKDEGPRIKKEKHATPSDPAEGIYVTYEMFGPYTKAVVDRMFRDRKRAEYIANL